MDSYSGPGHSFGSLPSNIPAPSQPIERKDLWGGAFLLYNVLSKEECDYFIQQSEQLGFHKVEWNLNLHENDNEDKNKEHEKVPYRINDRVVVQSQQLSDLFWSRISNHLSSNSENTNNNTTIDVHIKKGDPWTQVLGSPLGLWKASCLNTKWRIAKYFSGGLFGAHYDGSYVASEDERSLYTFMFYLNDGYQDGRTRFLEVDPQYQTQKSTDQSQKQQDSVDLFADPNVPKKVVAEAGPLKPGMALIFPQHLLHEGQPVTGGVKYVMRTEIVFQRDPTTAHEHDASIEDPYQEAVRLLKLAEELEISHKHDLAIKYYKKAFSLSPQLAKEYGY